MTAVFSRKTTKTGMYPSPNDLAFARDFFKVIFESSYLWLPLFLGEALRRLWMHYVRMKFVSGLEWLLLEIRLPREILKGPMSAEVLINMLCQTKDPDWWEYWMKGTLRAWFSLEIVSIGGEIHFYIYSQKFFKNLIEAQVYAQFPDAEVAVVDDYSKEFFADTENLTKEWDCWGTEMTLNKSDVFPIKTYIDYGLQESSTKEEQKTDPFTATLEFLGSLKQGESAWIQILIRGNKEDKDWAKKAKEEVDKLLKSKEKKDALTIAAMALTPGEKTQVEAIERNVAKQSFYTNIRLMYLARKDIYNKVNQASLIAAFKQYNSLMLNGFGKPRNGTGGDHWWDVPTQNYIKNIYDRKRKIKMLDAYRKRSCFYWPYERETFIMNAEALATLYHFPGGVAETPTLGRIEAKKSEAPTNLPL